MTDIPVFDFTMPNRRQSQDVFDTAYQAFIDRLPLFVTAMNQQAAELTALANVTVYSPFATYDIPATVYASDGLTYRCKGYNVSGDNPVGSVSGNWVAIVLRVQDLKDIAHNDIIGGDITKTAANTLTITACRCMNSTGQTPLQTTVTKTLAIPTVANTIYHIFIVRLVATGACEFRAYTTEAGVSGDAQVNAYRWLDAWRTNVYLHCCEGQTIDGIHTYFAASEMVFKTLLSTTLYAVNISSVFPPARCELIALGYVAQSQQLTMITSYDGVNCQGQTTCDFAALDNDFKAFGGQIYPLIQLTNLQVKLTIGDTTSITIQRIKLRR